MRVFICQHVPGAFGFITTGWLNALKDKGHTVERWDGSHAHWQRFDPDLYIGASGHQQKIPAIRRAKVAIHVNPYGPVDLGGINENHQAIEWVLRQNPDAVFGYGFEADRIIWSHWETKHKIPWVPMPTAADRTIYYDPQLPREYDIVYLGGRWAYKARTIDKYLLPVITDKQLVSRVYGWGDWPAGMCAGEMYDRDVVGLLGRGKVAPCISEEHTQKHGIDVPERVWKVALCGALAVHDAVPTLRREMPSLVVAQHPEHFHSLCLHYSRNDQERMDLAAQQKAEVLGGHTYHHRMSGLLAALRWAEEAQNMLK